MKIKVTVDIDEEVLAAMDRIARERDRSRSYLFREAAKEYTERHGHSVKLVESVPAAGNDPKE